MRKKTRKLSVNERQMLMQLHDKMLISSTTLLSAFGLKYEDEVKQRDVDGELVSYDHKACCGGGCHEKVD